MGKIKDAKSLDKVTHTVRRNQVVLQYGVGAMIDFPSQVLMTALPEEWKSPEIIHDERLERLLEVDYFISPSDKGVPFVRFPRWYFCPKCREFKPIEQWQNEYAHKYAGKRLEENDPYMLKELRCPTDYQELVPARIVAACEHGHIDDFPWIEWVHRKSRFGEKEICAHPSLKFKTGSSASSGLEGVEVECVTCGAKASLSGAFEKHAFEALTKSSDYGTSFLCTGNHPWKHEKSACAEFPRALQRGAASVYFPRVISSLVIPPYSSYLTAKIESSEVYKSLTNIIKDGLDDCDSYEDKNQFIIGKIEKYKSKLAEEIYEDEAAVNDILKRKLLIKADAENEIDKELCYKAEEYKALTGKISTSNFEKDEFLREDVNASLYDIPGVKSIALIHKVKEVTALIGYSRIQPTHGTDETVENFVSVKKKETSYYPASSSKGEGIFVEFDKEKLNEHFGELNTLSERIQKLKESYDTSYFGKNNPKLIDACFLFLHTLAHILIKELSFNCGYPTASLRERIYYGNAEGEEMCGFLLYTTGGDSEGTLGGLVRQGRTDCLTNIFKRALESARYCANDPVCNFSTGQGMDALNLAACHTCALLPETCCEHANILLDRVVLIGSLDNEKLGFFSEWIN